MEDKYIDLLLKKCLWFQKDRVLFINYCKENKDFVDKLVVKAKEMGITDIYLDEDDMHEYHDILKNISLEEMDKHPAFDMSVWNEYADRDATFLMVDTEFPGLMADIEPEKIAKATKLRIESRKRYKSKQNVNAISWCIAAVANQEWAEKLFPNDANALQKLESLIYEMCMVNTDDPVKAWEDKMVENTKIMKKLNELKIKTLHYKNSLGTDLHITLPENCLWAGAGTKKGIVNMPSYEVFTVPDYRYTNGIVYSSRPLIYSGKEINNFAIEFKDGKAIRVQAEKEQDVLQGIIDTGENNCYLGEVALVNYDSPISNTGLVFETTLIDENASCHLALGSSFPECVPNGESLSDDELKEKGLNIASNHVDFMIGTKDLEIEAETMNGEKIKIFENGNFVI